MVIVKSEVTLLIIPNTLMCIFKIENLKVTVQFETEGNGQNDIFSNMDRSEAKL